MDPQELYKALQEAEYKAWDSLARYEFMLFGHWAGVWAHLNRIGGFHKPSPFSELVDEAKYVIAKKADQGRAEGQQGYD